ncbi:MAG TPA: CehA/McbA family metallohydrolase [Chthonomonadaceae bacterium]|nr:CehA/McbA family metallohydrolase [Chthonomonadaceae bacterium]
MERVTAQPLLAQVKRLTEALDALGSPLSQRTKARLESAAEEPDEAKAVKLVQEALDPYCLLAVDINPEARVKVATGPARPELIEQGWRQFLVKVQNEAGVTAELKAISPNALPLHNSPKAELRDRWLDLQMVNGQPLLPKLSGLGLEYRIISLYSRDAGRREAKIAFNVGQGTQDLGFRNDADILFVVQPSTEVTFHVLDENRKPTTAMLLIRDKQGHVYPSQAKRLAPDFAFQPQIYRADGEKIKLPRGEYTVAYTRGPEYLTKTLTLTVGAKAQAAAFPLERWIDPSLSGWWSGDHHIHAAGCAHYTNPTEGVLAQDMIRHCLGEDLKIGCNLTWGPCFDFQKQFFTGAVDKVSQYPYLLRYDIEVSGFGSHQSGHLCLLNLKEQIYPGGTSDTHWPTLCLNTLKWAKKQGAVCGPAHSGTGLRVNSQDLPNYVIPPFDGIGAMEYIVDVTHEIPGPDGKPVPAVDFMSTVDTPYLAELNIWYHTLNCGYRTRISGETDFPCISGERVGKGRSYVKLDGKLDYAAWCEGIRQGRCYVSEGKSHLMDFKVNDANLGERGSELRLEKPGTVHATARVAALLPEKPAPYDKNGMYWNIERARIGESREVPVEVVVNGVPVARRTLVADGKAQDIAFDVPIERSSWIALRILGASHTNPIFVLVGDKPIRASRRSADWCLKSVDQCWKQKRQFIKPEEMRDAEDAYEHARESYRKILGECDAD